MSEKIFGRFQYEKYFNCWEHQPASSRKWKLFLHNLQTNEPISKVMSSFPNHIESLERVDPTQSSDWLILLNGELWLVETVDFSSSFHSHTSSKWTEILNFNKLNINLDFHILTWLNNILFCVGPEKCWSSQNVWTILTMFSEFNKQFRLTISVQREQNYPNIHHKHAAADKCIKIWRQMHKHFSCVRQEDASFTEIRTLHVDASIIIHDYWSGLVLYWYHCDHIINDPMLLHY